MSTDERETRENSARTEHAVTFDDLAPGSNYAFSIVDCQSAPDESPGRPSGFLATETLVPASLLPHITDGKFSGGWDEAVAWKAPHEWSDVPPVMGRYSWLRVDFDGAFLHVINDWFACTESIHDNACNVFELRFTDPIGRTQDWLLKVYPQGRLDVEVDGEPYTGPAVGAYAFDTSPMMPHQRHTIYELRVPVSLGHGPSVDDPLTAGTPLRRGRPPAAAAGSVEWHLRWLEPIVEGWTAVAEKFDPGQGGHRFAPQFADVREPLSLHGILLGGGGLTLLGDYYADKGQAGVRAIAVNARTKGATIRFRSEQPMRAEVRIWSLGEATEPSDTATLGLRDESGLAEKQLVNARPSAKDTRAPNRALPATDLHSDDRQGCYPAPANPSGEEATRQSLPPLGDG